MTPKTTDAYSVNPTDISKLRAIARHLVRDAADADDLVQDALVAALEGARSHGGASARGVEGSGWRWAVLRNLARNRARGRAARQHREGEYAVPEGVDDASEGAAAAERGRDLSRAVLALKEPYRTVILMRYFEDATAREIAARTDTKVDTVQRQLTRGKAELRRQLESQYGDRGSWAVALLPLTGTGVLKASALAAGWDSAARIGAVVVLLATAGITAVTWLERENPGEDTIAPQVEEPLSLADAAPIAVDPVVPELSLDRIPGLGAEVASPPTPKALAEPEAEAANAEPPTMIRVVDLKGRPVTGLPVSWVDRGRKNVQKSFGGTSFEHLPEWMWRRQSFTTDGRGVIEFDRYPKKSAINESWELGERIGLLGDGRDPSGTRTLVVADLVRAAGTVVDRDGTPLQGIRVSVSATLNAVSEFPLVLRDSQTFMWSNRARATSTESGEFDLGLVPSHRDFHISAVRDSYSSTSTAVPVSDEFALEIELPDATDFDTRETFGVVLDHDGSVVPNVHVSMGQRSDQADEQGRFRIVHSVSYPSAPLLTVRHPDGRFTTLKGPTRTEAEEDGGAGPFTLQLPKSMIRLTGRVVDAKGKPVSGMDVVLLNGTQRGRSNHLYEYHLRQTSEPPKTGPRGVFMFPRVLDREYDVRILDRKTLFVHDVIGVRPKSGPILVQIPADAFVDELKGIVEDYRGTPIAGARVWLSATCFRSASMRLCIDGDRVTTDKMGRFRISNAPHRGLQLVVETPVAVAGTSQSFPLEDFDVQSALRVTIDVACSARIDEPSASDADRIRFLDGKGEQLTVMEVTSGTRSQQYELRHTPQGHFPNFTVSQRAATAILFNGDQELRTIKISLIALELNRIVL